VIGIRRALRAEWVKLRTVRSTTWALLALLGVSAVFTALACAESHTEGGNPGNPGDSDIVLNSLAGILFGQMAAAVLGVLAITSEYSSRLIRTTLAAFPRRRTVLAAKTAVVGGVVTLCGLAASVSCFFVGQAILRGNGFTYENGYPAASLADGATLRAVAGTGIYLGLLAAFALGIGAIVRHTAGAITLVLALLLGPVIAISFLPESIAELLEKTSLMAAGIAIQHTVEGPDALALGPWAGLGVVSAYVAVALLGAFSAIVRRDA
jgi:ABC-2 type transport system permease protein